MDVQSFFYSKSPPQATSTFISALPIQQVTRPQDKHKQPPSMLNSHESLGIAQIVFYVPIIPTAIWLMRRNGRIRPRLAWWPLIPFSLSTTLHFILILKKKKKNPSTKSNSVLEIVRLAGGPVTIALEQKPSIGLYVAAIILLNVGVVPLIIATLGYVRIV